MRNPVIILFALTGLLVSACGTPKVQLFQDATAPLQEFTLQGTAPGKVLVLPVRGIISDVPSKGFLQSKPSMVQELVSHLRLAEKDKEIKAIVLKIDSPGGSITASDILYHEINGLKQRSGIKVVAAMMGVAASGGYYICLPADCIFAHPTTVTGSIGVIFMGPKVMGLMEKIGVDMEVSKSGDNKDMGSAFRPSTQEENAILDDLIVQLADRFLDLVAGHRNLDEQVLDTVSSARIFLADDALQLGLVDKIGYLDDALTEAKRLAQLPTDAKVVVYRRSEYPDDNVYNTFMNQSGEGGISLVNLGLEKAIPTTGPGFYYLWLPGSNND
jgi:protease IV